MLLRLLLVRLPCPPCLSWRCLHLLPHTLDPPQQATARQAQCPCCCCCCCGSYGGQAGQHLCQSWSAGCPCSGGGPPGPCGPSGCGSPARGRLRSRGEGRGRRLEQGRMVGAVRVPCGALAARAQGTRPARHAQQGGGAPQPTRVAHAQAVRRLHSSHLLHGQASRLLRQLPGGGAGQRRRRRRRALKAAAAHRGGRAERVAARQEAAGAAGTAG